MKTNNLFLVTMIALFGVVVESSGQVGTYPANETSYLGVDPFNSLFSVHIGKDAAPNALPTAAQIAAGQEGMNCFIGVRSGRSITSGNNNVFLGYQSGIHTTTGGYNSFLGRSAGANNVEGSYNTFVGFASGYGNGNGTRNTYLGHNTGYKNLNGVGNVFIGYESGYPFTGPIDNKLMISNESTFTPLIYGDFAKKFVDFNGSIGVNLLNNAAPANRLEVRHGTTGFSGLRLANLTNTYAPNSSSNKFLTVDDLGDVVLKNLPNLANVTNTLINNNINTLTSTVNGVAASAPIVNTVVNTITNNSLVTKVNGVSSNSVPLPSTTTVTAGNASVTVTPSGNNYSIVANIPVDNDPNPTNELQTLFQLGNTVTLSNNGGTITLPTDTDDQTLALTGNVLSISQGNNVTLPSTTITSGDVITTTVTNPSPNTFTVAAKNIYTDDGFLDSNRNVNMNNFNLVFNASTSPQNGRIYIGGTPSYPTTNGDYRLYVEGGILSERVRVALRGNIYWADYVFNDDYKLMPLNEVEMFVKEHKHLPGIESAEELVKSGIDVVEMQSKQMGKIEELTLHIIDQNKALEKQSQEIEELKAQVKLLLERK